MAVQLIIAPANAGKTHYCLQRLRATQYAAPAAEIRAVLPNRAQAAAFRRRLSDRGELPGVRVNTFGDLYAEILAEANRAVPVASDHIVKRLMRASVDAVGEREELRLFAAIQRRPGFTVALADFIGELKQFRVDPLAFQAAASSYGPRLEELAAIYAEYQQTLIRLGWADAEGLGWLALDALQADQANKVGWKLLLVDGFDSFNPTQLETLRQLGRDVDSIVVTLSGEPGMARPAHRRFARTFLKLQGALQPEIQTLPPRAVPVPALAHLEARLFETAAVKVPADGRITFIAAQTQAIEAREALRWLKARIIRDGVMPGECAVIGLALAGYRPFLSEAAREFGLPIFFAEGESLERSPVIAALFNVLSLALKGWGRRPLLDALRCPYFDLLEFGLLRTSGAADELNEAAHFAQVIGGLDQWQEALLRLADAESTARLPAEQPEDGDRAPALPTGPRAAQLWDGLAAFAARVTPAASASLADYVAWVEVLLEADGLAIRDRALLDAGSAERDAASLEAFGAVLKDLVLGEQVMGARIEMNFVEFYGELRGAVRSAHYQAAEAGRLDAIYAGNLAGVRGVSRRAVALLGLSEGLFPAPLSEEPFLSDADRADLHGAGLALEPRLRSDQQTLFYEAITRASEYLLLTRPYLADDGERWEASPYWNAALSLFDTEPAAVRADTSLAATDAASPLELLVAAARARALPELGRPMKEAWLQVQRGATVMMARQAGLAEGPFEGQAGALAASLRAEYGPHHIWSASRLEVYGECQFRFFVEEALGLELRAAPAAGFDLAQLGGMLHTILERVYQAAVDPGDLDALVASLPSIGGAAFGEAPRRHGFRTSALWDAQKAEWLELLQATLAALNDASEGFRPAHFEVKFGIGDQPALVVETTAGPIRFHGVIDRVDIDAEGGMRLIDYKTVASGLTARDVGEGRRLQLPLYALAAEQVFGSGPSVDGFYWGIRKGHASPLRLSKFAYPKENPHYQGVHGAVEVAVEHATAYVQGIQAGEFAPEPPPGGCPPYCAARLFCWRYRP